jgi:hypothetical protein
MLFRLETAMEQERENLRHQVDSALDRLVEILIFQPIYELILAQLGTIKPTHY